jgi:pyruvate,orthophosphate dikinase
MMSSSKYVYHFSEGDAGMKSLLGGKGANLAEMSRIGLPVPTGFTLTTEACNAYIAAGKQFPAGLWDEVIACLLRLETATGKTFGDAQDPLLVSVRSGAPVSMPGMMDTILNLGLNDVSVEGFATKTQNPRFAYDCYRRFIQMFSDVVLGVAHYHFEERMEDYKQKAGLTFDYEIPAEGLKEIIAEFKVIVQEEKGFAFPQEVQEQLKMSIEAVFGSWDNARAIAYRKLNKIPDDLGTAVNVQIMVFGNMGDDSGTGVAFTRNPSTGEKVLYGEFLINAQGEDVVAGIRTPVPIARLREKLPGVYQQFEETCQLLESHYRDVQDIEFTVESGKLYMLQTRSGKRTAKAAVKCAVDMVREGLITEEEAILRMDPEQISQLLHRQVDPKFTARPIAQGLPASPGAGCGQVVFDADEAERLGRTGAKVVLVRSETTPDDIHGIIYSQGILTARGGMTSHAAVVARGMGMPCICGCESIKIDLAAQSFKVGELVVKAGDVITVYGTEGQVILGEVPTIDPVLDADFTTLLSWADQIRTLRVRANADNPKDAAKALELGAEGVGLCRTEHMFMEQERLPYVQAMIMADSEAARQEQLDHLLVFQQEDFYGILKTMAPRPVTIRLLDPPLHEFLPNYETLLLEIENLKFHQADPAVLRPQEEILRKIRQLHEANPMLGQRGCRLGIVFPEIYLMQVQAIFNAMFQLKAEGVEVFTEIEIPLVIDAAEMIYLKQAIMERYELLRVEKATELNFTVGTMIELPRACMVAGELAQEAAFFSFGTNDLTQTTLGFSRDDAEAKFIPVYLEKKILPVNPFAVLDRQGVGALMRHAVEQGRAVNPKILIGICGEHGGEPSSIEFCHIIGLDYVSCSPYRIPVARLAAAQAALNY